MQQPIDLQRRADRTTDAPSRPEVRRRAPRSAGRTLAVTVALVAVVAALGLSTAVLVPAPPAVTSAPVDPASATAHALPAPTPVAPSAADRARMGTEIRSSLAARGVPTKAIYLPNFNGGGLMDGNVVSPITRAAPAAMGIGDIGVRNTTGTPTPYVLDSTSWEGTFTLNSGDFFYIDNDGPDTFGIQLNTVLTNVTVWGSPHDDFWTQDVMFYTPSQDEVQFIDNIWNFSNPSTQEPASTFHSYSGTPVSPSYYYDLGPLLTAELPFTVHLFINSSLTNNSGSEFSTVTFGYDLVSGGGITIGAGVYDTVEFNSEVASSPSVPRPHFQVNGGALTPTNFLLYDSELMIGGPGGGSTTQIYAIDATMQLQYLAAGHYVNDPTAWSAGTDTGESSQGVAVSYATPGTVELTGGPSFVEPLWNATPGGNAGQLTLTGTISPDNAFVFVSTGNSINNTTVAWAPVVPGGTYRWTLPPGLYTGEAMLADHDSHQLTWLGSAGTTSTVDIALPVDLEVGVDTPLFAWNNAELASISYTGSGTESSPYLLYNNQAFPLSPWFGEANDFLFPVFPGVLIANTTAYFELEAPPPFSVVLPPGLAAELGAAGLPDTNQLQIELYGTVHATILGGSDISGWLDGSMLGTTLATLAEYPSAEVVLWGATDSLIADNVFEDQGVGLTLMQGSDNVVFGNEFLNGPLMPIGFDPQFGIWEFESGDLIYNNVFDTSVTAFSPNYNLYNGFSQFNVNRWNLTGDGQSSSVVNDVNGIPLAGSLIGSPVVCGNWWYDYVPGSQIPYDENPNGAGYQPLIYDGGDYCPAGPYGEVGYNVTFSEHGVTSGTWSVTLAGATAVAPAGDSIVFGMPNGTWDWSVGAEPGLVAAPASGSIPVNGAPSSATVVYSAAGGTGVAQYVATIAETGLPAGTNWTVAVTGGPTVTTNTSEVALPEPDGTYAFTVTPVADYTLTSTTGDVTIAGGSATAWVTFTANPGWLNVSVSPSNAAVWVNGQVVALIGGAFSVEEHPGTVELEATLAGYAPFFDNVTVAAGHPTPVSVQLTPLGSSSTGGSGTTSSGSGLSTGQFEALVAALIVVAIAIVVAALLLRRRGGPPPPMRAAPAAFTPVAAPATTTPEYLEDEAPPSPPPG
jgi:thermopsin